jgi:hypothetical protein
MAYFSNGSEGMCFDDQCQKCKYGENYCPIWGMQQEFNYEACNNELAQKIMNWLVKNDGTCEMYKEFEEDFKIKKT